MSSIRRAIVYIDGFNLYFGLREQGWRKYYWLNISQFSRYLARDGQRVMLVKYFTSRIKGPAGELKRQNETAIKTLSNVQRIEGQYRTDPILSALTAMSR